MKHVLQNLDAFEGAVIFAPGVQPERVAAWEKLAFFPVLDPAATRIGTRPPQRGDTALRDIGNFAPALGIVVNSPQLVDQYESVADVFLVPGEICRQADTLAAVARTRRPVILERGPFLRPEDLLRALEHFEDASQVVLVDAGSAFGYSDRVLDPRSLLKLGEHDNRSGVNLSELMVPHGQKCRWRAPEESYDLAAEAVLTTAMALGADFVVAHDGAPAAIRPEWLEGVLGRVRTRLERQAPAAAGNMAGVTIYDF